MGKRSNVVSIQSARETPRERKNRLARERRARKKAAPAPAESTINVTLEPVFGPAVSKVRGPLGRKEQSMGEDDFDDTTPIDVDELEPDEVSELLAEMKPAPEVPEAEPIRAGRTRYEPTEEQAKMNKLFAAFRRSKIASHQTVDLEECLQFAAERLGRYNGAIVLERDGDGSRLLHYASVVPADIDDIHRDVMRCLDEAGMAYELIELLQEGKIALV